MEAQEKVLLSQESNNPQLVANIIKDKQTSSDFQKRKHPHWNENYLLLRDKVIKNRLTQRQTINIPIMAETYDTWASNVDETPLMTYQPLDKKRTKDKKSAMVWDQIWLDYYEKWKLDEIDALDKKNVFLYGRGFKKIYWQNGDLQCRAFDPYDFDIDPKANPLDIMGTAMYFIQKNVFLPLNEILANESYSKQGRNSLKMYLGTKSGKISLDQTGEAKQRHEERMRMLGVDNFDEFSGSDLIVELNEIYKKIWHPELKSYKIHYIVLAANHSILYNKPVEDAIGVNFIPFVTWSEDPDGNDIWNDSKADRVRPMNRVMNTWLAQLIENRTFRNFGMFFYDSSNPKYKPQSFTPRPMGMYPMPGDPNKTVKQVPIGSLTDNLKELNFFKSMIESATAMTSTEKGVNKQEGNRTLGEIQIDLRESTQRVATRAKYYRNAWEEFAVKFQKMLEANRTEKYILYKKGSSGDLYEKTVNPASIKSPKGFKVTAKLKSEMVDKDNENIQKLMFVRQMMPDNQFVQMKVKEDALSILGWSQEDVQEAMRSEEQKSQQIPEQADQTAQEAPQGSPTPELGAGVPPELQQALQGV